MARTEAATLSTRWLAIVGVIATGAFVVALLTLEATQSYDTWGAFLLLPVLMVISYPALSRQASREGDRRVVWLLFAALFAKLLGAVLRHHFALSVYGGVADAVGYHHRGVELAVNFRQGNFETGLESSTGTDFIRILTGAIYAVIGPTQMGGFVFYSWLGFWGLFWFYRAFVLAVPDGRKRLYAGLLFFLPSLVFWPSSIGKEAWMVMTLGLAAFGAARFLTGATYRGLVLAGSGLFLAAIVRPHVAALLGIGMAVAYVFHRPSEHLRELAPILKFFALGVLAILSVLLFLKTEDFVEGSHVDSSGSISDTLESTRERTAQGGSSFSPPSVTKKPYLLPFAAITVLFRPFPQEAGNSQGLVAALEGVVLGGLSLMLIRWMFAALGSVRRRAYAALAIAYTTLFVIVYSSIANFGILTRQRVQVLPFYLVLLAIPPKEKRIEPDSRELAEASASR
jgi:hypothetical protein